MPPKSSFFWFAVCALLAAFLFVPQAHAEMVDHPVVRLQSLDKVTARTMTFEARVGSTVKFGSIYIRVQACRKAPPIEKPESASFLQIWEVTPQGESKWIFSGWMFASSPALSPMDHPIYDVWVLDCLERKSTDPVPKEDTPGTDGNGSDPQTQGEGGGEVTGPAAQPPETAPPKPKVHIPGFEETLPTQESTKENVPEGADAIGTEQEID